MRPPYAKAAVGPSPATRAWIKRRIHMAEITNDLVLAKEQIHCQKAHYFFAFPDTGAHPQ
jgi:hypothetical protein